jgi:excisionase family DNA binding protein
MPVTPRFLPLTDVAEILNISSAQVYALVRNGDLPAIQVGGRGQWRVEVSELEAYIQRMYQQTRDRIRPGPGPTGGPGEPGERDEAEADGGAAPAGPDPDGADPDSADPDSADPDGGDPDSVDPDGAEPAPRGAQPE